MSPTSGARSKPPAGRPPRYLAARLTSGSDIPFFCSGDSLDSLQVNLQTARVPGRFRVFDREPAARGIDAEMAGEFLVATDGAIQWTPLRPA